MQLQGIRLNKYRQYNSALVLWVTTLGGGLLLTRLPEQDQPTAVIFALFGLAMVVMGFLFTLGCPNCKVGIVRSIYRRVSARKLHNCAGCGLDLRQI
jgi:hypothetical protein